MFSRRSTVTLWLALLALLAVFASRPTSASASDQNHFQPVSPEELAMKSEPQAPGAPAIILYRQVDRDDSGQHEFDYVRIKVLTEEGRKYADVEIPYDKERLDVKDIKARTVRPDGSIVDYQGNVFEKTVAKAKGVKYLAKTFTLPDVQAGSIIEYYYTYKFNGYLFDSHWILSEGLFTKSAAFSLRPYGREYVLKCVWNHLPTGTSPPTEASGGIYRLTANNIPAFQTEDFMPPDRELKSRVDFIYSEPLRRAEGGYWTTVDKRINEAMEKFTDKRKAMQQAVAQIVSPEDPPEIKLQKIYVRVQQLRNKAYEERKTLQEEKRDKDKDLNNVEDVWKRGYGNGLELNWLYVALARAAGFDAYSVLLSSRKDYFFDPKLEDYHRLNADVTLVKLNGKEIYCDPAEKFAPFGLLPWYETGVSGLRVDKDGGSWIKTPVPPSSVSRIERKAELSLSDTGDLQGRLTLTFSGLEAMERREEKHDQDDAERNKYLENEVKEYIPAAIDVELINRPDWSNPASPFVATFSLKIPGWASGAGRRVLVPVGLFSAPEKNLFEHANRVHPIYMEFPFQEIDDVTIEIPAGWQVNSLPPAQKQDGHIITYAMKAEDEKGKLHIMRTLDTNILYLQTQYYASLRNFVQQVRTGDEQQIVLQQNTATASK
jgi:hypothetical protein